ncbi:hypothetical protein [Thermopirellula anaerolimosa]
MGNPFKKVRPGQKLEIPAEAYNAFVDAAMAQRMRRHDLEAGKEGGPPAVLVRNETGQTVARFSVVGLDDPIILPSQNEAEFARQTALRAQIPDPGVHGPGRLAVVTEPLPAGQLGRAVLHGVVPAKIECQHSAHPRVWIKPSEQTGDAFTLYSGFVGWPVCWWPQTGSSLGLVLAGNFAGLVRFALSETLAYYASAAAEVVDSAGQPLGTTITVHDALGIFTGPANTRGYATWTEDAGRWEIIQLQCVE